MVLTLSLAKRAESTAIARKREENPEILTKLMRKRLTRNIRNRFRSRVIFASSNSEVVPLEVLLRTPKTHGFTSNNSSGIKTR